jgi:NADP-dependent 3-hydroxy acid dehydrogenase YdfG
MVSLSEIHASNAQLPSFLPKQVVAVFAGATSGIGEATLKTFVRYAVEPRIYLFARNEASAERVIADCRQINPAGDFIFVQVDLSLIRETDRACEEVKSKEKRVNLVVLSAGEMKLDRSRKLF